MCKNAHTSSGTIQLYIFAALICLSCSKSSKPLDKENDGFSSCLSVEEVLLRKNTDFSQLNLNFSNAVEYVFKNHCASCHFGNGSYLPQLDDYVSTMTFVDSQSPLESPLLTALDGRNPLQMPPAYRLDRRDAGAYKFLRDWLQAGSPR